MVLYYKLLFFIATLYASCKVCFYSIERKICANDITTPNRYKHIKIPKRIFAYWEGKETITTIGALNSWKTHLFDYDIILLNPSNLSFWLNCTSLCCRTAETCSKKYVRDEFWYIF